MKFYPVKTPKIIQKVFRSFTWNIDSHDKPASRFIKPKAWQGREIYLTFDDGPVPDITPWVLNTLSNYNAKATFFCIGKNVKNHPAIFQNIIDEGHTIGNHTFNHLNGWKTSTQKYVDNIDKAESISIQYSVGSRYKYSKQFSSKLFRPPYGRIKPSQVKKLMAKGYKIIMWDVLSGDFDQKLTKEDCFQNVIKNIKNGSIVVFHDSEKAFKNLEYTLPKVLEYCTENGFIFKVMNNTVP